MRKSAFVLFLLFASFSAFAQPFIAAGGSGVAEETMAGLYDQELNSIKHSATATGNIQFRYTINDTTATGSPSWSNIELRAFDPGASSFVRVQIYRHTLGGSWTNGVCTSNDNALYAITTCTLSPAINFNTGDLYTALVTVNRTSTAVAPIFNGFRLY